MGSAAPELLPARTAPQLTSRGSRLRGFGTARYGAYAIILAALLVTGSGTFPLDDAYIVLHNARVLLSGGDPLYGSSALVGSTSPIHLLLVAVFGLLLPLPLASLTVAALSAFLYAIGLDTVARKMGARHWQVPVLVLAGLLGGVVPLQLLNGLETGLAAAAVAWMLALADDRRLPVLAALAPFIRPELGILSMLLLARRWWAAGWPPSRDLLAIVLVALPLAAWMVLTTGHLMPQTAYAKMLFFAENDVPVGLRMGGLLGHLDASGLLWLCLGLISVRQGGWLRLAFFAATLVAGMATIPSAFSWNHYRYLVPLVPLLVAGVATLSRERWGAIAVLVVAAGSLISLPVSLRKLEREQAYWSREAGLLAATTAKLPTGSTVLIHDAGLVAWNAPRLRLVDAVGLKSPASISWHRRFTRHKCHYGEAVDAIARQTQARYALLLDSQPWSCIGTSLESKGWRLTRIAGPSHYRLFALTPPKSRP